MNLAEASLPSLSRRHGLPEGPVVEPAWPGVMNDVCVVGLAEDRYVIRARDDPSAVEEFEREAWCSDAARAVGLTTPTILFWGVENGAAYSIQRFVPGRSAETLRPSRHWSYLGECARKIAASTLDGAPEGLFSRFGRDLVASWSAHLAYNLGELTTSDPLIGRGVYELSDLAEIRSVVRALSDLQLDHGLVHGDLALRNLIVDDHDAPVLIDWGAATTGPVPHTDLVNLLRNRDEQGNPDDHEISAFVRGYGADPALVLPQALDLQLLHALDVTRWALEHAPERISGAVDQARTLVRSRLAVGHP